MNDVLKCFEALPKNIKDDAGNAYNLSISFKGRVIRIGYERSTFGGAVSCFHPYAVTNMTRDQARFMSTKFKALEDEEAALMMAMAGKQGDIKYSSLEEVMTAFLNQPFLK